MSIDDDINILFKYVQISSYAREMIKKSPRLIAAIGAYAADIRSGKAKALALPPKSSQNPAANTTSKTKDKSAVYNLGFEGISSIVVGPDLFPTTPTLEEDLFAVSMLAHELGHYVYRTIDQQKFTDLTRSMQQRIDDDLYHEGEAMLFAWNVDEEIAKNGGPPLDFHQQGRRALLEREIAAANVVARNRMRQTPLWKNASPEQQNKMLERAKPTNEDMIHAFAKLNEMGCTSDPNGNAVSYKQMYALSALGPVRS